MTSRRLLTTLALAAALMAGCERNLETPYDPDLDFTPPQVPSALQAQVGDREIRLSWTVGDPAKVSRYMVYRADTVALEFRLHDSSTTTSFTDNSVINGINYFYKVSSRDLAGLEGDRSTGISASPQLYTVRINEDSTYTRSQTVRLTFTATNASLMRITSDTTRPGTWETFSLNKTWTFSGGAGTKWVFAKIRGQSGVETAGWLTDTIVYDNRAAISLVTASDSVLAPGDSLLITVHCGEPDGHAACSLGVNRNIPMYDDGTGIDTAADDGIYSGVFLATSDDTFEDIPLYARFTDRAGNNAISATADWRISVRRPPVPPVWVGIDPELDDPRVLHLSWVVGNIAPFSHFVIRRSTTPGLGLAAPIIKIDTRLGTSTFNDTGLTPNTTYYYTIEAVLENGLSGLSPEDSGTTSIDRAPDSVTLLPPSVLEFNEVSLAWTQSGARDFAAYRLHRAQTPTVTEASPLVFGTNLDDVTTYRDTSVTGSSLYYYRVFVVDLAGQSTGSNTLTVATPQDLPPSDVTLADASTADSSVKLVWSPSVDADFASYRIYRGTSQAQLSTKPGDSLLVNIITERNTTQHEETGLAQVYYYRLFVFDRGGQWSTGSNIVSGP